MAVQWYESDEGRRRLQVEMAAIDAFNAPRPEELRLVGRKHRQGNLILAFAFKPLVSRTDFIVRGEVVLSSLHPQLEPVARIVSPAPPQGPHMIDGEALRKHILQRTIPLDWSRQGPVLCMFEHHDPSSPSAWTPSMTAVSAVLNAQSWFLNFLHWRSTSRWPYDSAA